MKRSKAKRIRLTKGQRRLELIKEAITSPLAGHVVGVENQLNRVLDELPGLNRAINDLKEKFANLATSTAHIAAGKNSILTPEILAAMTDKEFEQTCESIPESMFRRLMGG